MLAGRGRSWAARADNEGFSGLPPGALDVLAEENAFESNPAAWYGADIDDDKASAPLGPCCVALAVAAVA